MAIAAGLDPAFTTATTGSAVTTAGFSPVANSLIVAVASTDSGTGTITVVFSDSVGLSWTEILPEQTGTGGGTVSAAWAYTTPSQSGMTVTTTWTGTGTSGGKGVKVTTFTGAHSTVPIGASSRGTSATNNLTVSYTNTVDGSLGMAAGTEFNALGLPTSTDTETAYHIASTVDGISVYKAATSSGTGNTVNLNLDAGSTGTAAWSYFVFELLPAAVAAASDPPRRRPQMGALIQL